MLINMADERLKLSVEQIELLLFFAEHRKDPPRRVLPCNYEALLRQGLIVGKASRSGDRGPLRYRITAHGREVALHLNTTAGSGQGHDVDY